MVSSLSESDYFPRHPPKEFHRLNKKLRRHIVARERNKQRLKKEKEKKERK
jgi:hypothetical protein